LNNYLQLGSTAGPDSGVLLVNKPQGWTSHDVVNCIRRRFKIKKVGHCGTLDPLATGLLIILTGKATKLSEMLSSKDKVYQTTMLLGSETDSHDADGKVTVEKPWDHITEDDIIRIAGSFVGEQDQLPPMVSAVKKDGKPLYKLARQGIEVERQPRQINIHSLDIDSIELPKIHFTVHCTKGTYVRVLCYDMGRKLGTAAHMAGLSRLSIGRFRLEDAFEIDQIKSWDKEQFLENFTPLHDFIISYAQENQLPF